RALAGQAASSRAELVRGRALCICRAGPEPWRAGKPGGAGGAGAGPRRNAPSALSRLPGGGRKRLPGEERKCGPASRRLHAMAALGRQVFNWHRLVPLTWAHVARQTHQGEQKRTCPSLLCKLTIASSGGGLEKLSHVESRTYVQEPACRIRLTRYSLEKRRTPVAPGFVEREKVISSLLDMGFSDVHINGLLHLWPSTHTQQLLDIISELILLGLNPEPVYVALKQSPQLLKLPVVHMKKRSGYLRKLGLGEGKLKTVLLCCPEIFTMHQRDIDSIVGVLKERCLFTVQQVTKILHRCPYVLREDPGELEYKFQVRMTGRGFGK
ncbi:unnamed protein product, partial [Gulo gulo]